MHVTVKPGDVILRRALNGWVIGTVEELDDGVEVLSEAVSEESPEDPEAVIGAIWLLFGEAYGQCKRREGYTCLWHKTGWENEGDEPEDDHLPLA